jgi:hypothetical protein
MGHTDQRRGKVVWVGEGDGGETGVLGGCEDGMEYWGR